MTSLAASFWKRGVFSLFRAVPETPARKPEIAPHHDRLRAIDTRSLSVSLQHDIGLRDGRPVRKGS
ncbi:hypothetical protein [Pannonibacter tanglangensis]|uniref:Uncharacterized protein n=1 Tax=Pannonibacter tanglangensis TaxID=2750084 RepID=A0ABW9ZNB1_9HYPH|nr:MULTISPECIES: hypothetical protein [unclassified Pannonibacter]NBN65061.1 hypothetical protein [Pannonibacter sp. XCT-34]